MNKLKMHSPNLVDTNIEKISALFPNCITESKDENGELKNIDYTTTHEHKNTRMIKVEGELFFGAADLFQNTLKRIAEDDTKTKIII